MNWTKLVTNARGIKSTRLTKLLVQVSGNKSKINKIMKTQEKSSFEGLKKKLEIYKRFSKKKLKTR